VILDWVEEALALRAVLPDVLREVYGDFILHAKRPLDSYSANGWRFINLFILELVEKFINSPKDSNLIS